MYNNRGFFNICISGIRNGRDNRTRNSLCQSTTSSVARGGAGGLEPPHWLVKYAKSHLFGGFEADFLWKIENSPPVGKQPPLKRSNFRFRPKNQAQNRWRPFFFFFFFLETTCFWAEKTFEFPSFPRNFVSIFGQTVWNWFKNNEIRVKVVCTLLTLSK